MNRTPKSIISLLLVCAMLLPLAACSETAVNTDETVAATEQNQPTANETVVEEEEVDDLAAVIESLPDANYDGHTFTQYMADNQLTTTIFMRQCPDEEMTGEPINDALWTRDRAIENKYNITLAYEASGSAVGDATRIVQSGDDAIGLLYQTMVTSQSFVNSGYSIDMASISEIDLSQPYWSQNATRDLAIDGHVFYATGDITTRYAGAPYILIFNKKLFDERQFAYPYDDVIEGTWTMDKLQSLVVNQYQDLSGDGKYGSNDFYGFAYEGAMQGVAFYNGFGYNAVKLDGREAIVATAQEDHINAIDTLTAFAALPDVRQEPAAYAETAIFEEDRALFVGQTACNLFMLTDMETDFGVLPSPKQNEAQDGYYSYCNLHCATSVHVPKSTQNLSRTGTIVNALAAASRVSSMRAQYEVTLQYRQTRDEQSVQMIQIASEAATYDPANLYSLGGLFGTINTCIGNGTAITSRLKSVEKVITKTFSKLVGKMLDE